MLMISIMNAREMIDNGLNGYIVENGNINELANQIILVCEDEKV